MKRRLATTILILSALPGLLAAREAPKDFRYTLDTNPLLGFKNAAALGGYGLGKLTYAELDAVKENGELKSTSESPDAFELGVSTESYLAITPRMAFYGKLSWSYSGGKNMGGPVLMDPDYNPINFYESTTGTKGNRKKEMFDLAGGLGYSINDNWSLGARIDYCSGDYTKTKDPRFNNIWMDLKADAGVWFRPGENFSAGLSAFWRNTLEQVKGGVLGTKDTQYYISVDKGCFFGINELLEGDNAYISTSSYRLMNNNFFGVELQVAAGNFYSELSAATRKGFYGNRSSASPVFFEFGGMEISYDGTLLVPSGTTLNRFHLNAAYKPVTSLENSYDYVTPAGKSTYVKYNGQTERSKSTNVEACLSWNLYTGTDGIRPVWDLGAQAAVALRNCTTTIYPYYRIRNNQVFSIDLHALRNFIGAESILGIGLEAGFHMGMGPSATDGAYSSTSGSTLKKFDSWLNLQHEYETAPHVCAGLNITYTRIFSETFSAYVKVSNRFATLLSDPTYLGGKTRNIACIAVGCNF